MPHNEHPMHQAHQDISHADGDSIFQNAPIGIFRTNPQGTYIFVNPTLARIYGFESPRHLMDEVTDIGAQLYVDRRDRENFLRLLERQGYVENYECRQLRRNGSIFWSSRNAWVIYDNDRNIY